MKIVFDHETAMLADKRMFYGEYATQLWIDVYDYIASKCISGEPTSFSTTNSEIKKAIKYSGSSEDIGNVIVYLRQERILWYKHKVTGNKAFRRGSGRYSARALKHYAIGDDENCRMPEHLFEHFRREEMR